MKPLRMKSIVVNKYGSSEVLEIQEIDVPIVKSGEVQIKVKFSAVSKADTMMRKGEPRFARLFIGLRKPSNPRIGTCFSGVIVKKGSDVKNFDFGDEVFGLTGFNFGANSEFVVISAQAHIWKKPKSLSFEQAACMCDGVTTSMNFLTQQIKAEQGQRILINGASGSLGLAGIGIAQSLGLNITATSSVKNENFLRTFKVNDWLDYNSLKDDISSKKGSQKDSHKFDVIYDTHGSLNKRFIKNSLIDGGVYLTPVLNSKIIKYWLNPFRSSNNKMVFAATGLSSVKNFHQYVNKALEQIQLGNLKVFIDRVFSFAEFQEAHQYVDSGFKRGNVVLKHPS